MTALLWGLHKEDMAEFWQSSEVHGGLIVQEAGTPELQPTTKVLGGNMGIRMSALTTLPPFFSPYYFYNKTPLLARGEDTLMGLAASRSQIKCLDIQTPIFHDTYGDYPKIPNLKNDSSVRDRLYYACTGWIGRNVFLRWKTGHAPTEFFERGRGSISVLGGEDIAMFNTANKEGAWKFMKFMTSEYAQEEMSKCGQIPVNMTALDSQTVKDASFAPFLEAITTAKARPTVASWSEIDNALTVAMTDMIVNGADVQQTLDQLAVTIDGLLAE